MKLVYFMRRADGVGPIKIGCSELPKRRLQAMQVWSPEPLEILASVSGTFDDETRLHRELAEDRLHGEWFEASRKVLAVVATAAATGALPPAGASDRTVRIEALYRGGKTLVEIGDEFGITRERARQILRKAGVPSFGHRPGVGRRLPSAATRNDETVVELARSGATVMEIVREVGGAPSSVRHLLRTKGIAETPAKLGAAFKPEVTERNSAIAHDYAAGMKVGEIVKKHGIYASDIYRALKRLGHVAERKPRRTVSA